MNRYQIIEAFIFSVPSLLLIVLAKNFLEAYLIVAIFVLALEAATILIMLLLKLTGSYRPTIFFNIRFLSILFYVTIFSIFGATRIAKSNASFPTSVTNINSISGNLIASPSISASRVNYKIALTHATFVMPLSPSSDAIGSAKGVVSVSVEKPKAFHDGVSIGDSLTFKELHFSRGLVFSKAVNQNKEISSDKTYASLIGKKFFTSLERSRRLLRKWANEGGVTAGLMLALIDGERLFVDEAVSRAYAKAGVAHLLALSGMHLGVIATVFLFFLKPIIGRQLALLLVSILCFFYSIFAGASPSLVRAVIMLFFLTLSKYKGGKSNIALVISCSLPLSIFVQPHNYNSVALILSYLALSGIVVFEPFISKLFRLILPKNIATLLGASYGATLATSWWLLPKFGYVSSGGILGALFLTPITFLLMSIGMLALGFWLVGLKYLSDILLLIAKPLYELNRILLLLFSSFPQLKKYSSLLLYFLPIVVLIILEAVIHLLSRKKVCGGGQQFLQPGCIDKKFFAKTGHRAFKKIWAKFFNKRKCSHQNCGGH